MMKRLIIASAIVAAISCSSTANDVTKKISSIYEETPVFITIGQSNADGSAEFDPNEDARLKAWYESGSNPHNMKMWYRSTYIVNQPEGSRWVFDGTTTDVEPGWLELWYRNENTSGRTDMNMIHGYGTWSTGDDFACAQGRRGMEGEFGVKFQEAFPGQEIYFMKLGCSGSQISTWTGDDNHNWDYFYENIWTPAVSDLLAQGKKPRLAGIWWMQGCGDMNRSEEYYTERLTELIEKCRTTLGFPDAKFYIGHIVKPGGSPTNPTASRQFGQGVRDAQDAVTTPGNPHYIANTFIIDTDGLPFQGDNLHFNHIGINGIGDRVSQRVIADGFDGWAPFTTPGKWEKGSDGKMRFIPDFGNPKITYKTVGKRNNKRIEATLDYGTWKETKERKE